MSETTYRITMTVPLGKRNGTMMLHQTGEMIDGWLEVMGWRNPLSGLTSEDGSITVSGILQTLMSMMPYTAAGTIRGSKIRLNLMTSSGASFPLSGEELESDGKVL